MTEIEIIDLTPENIADYGVCGYKDIEKHLTIIRSPQCPYSVKNVDAILETAK